jgi:hypothetical protein
MNTAFMNAISEALLREASMDELIGILREYRDKGLSAQAALEVLQSLRARADESTEDRVLEIMDIVAGFCAPHVRVWSAT